jgi:hypothetical protein
MPKTLTTELLAADFADIATDFPCTVTFTEPGSGVSETLAGTYGQAELSPAHGAAGLLEAYRLSVWVPARGWTTKPKPTRLVTVNVTNPQSGAVTSTVYQTLLVSDDGEVMELMLGDQHA